MGGDPQFLPIRVRHPTQRNPRAALPRPPARLRPAAFPGHRQPRRAARPSRSAETPARPADYRPPLLHVACPNLFSRLIFTLLLSFWCSAVGGTGFLIDTLGSTHARPRRHLTVAAEGQVIERNLVARAWSYIRQWLTPEAAVQPTTRRRHRKRQNSTRSWWSTPRLRLGILEHDGVAPPRFYFDIPRARRGARSRGILHRPASRAVCSRRSMSHRDRLYTLRDRCLRRFAAMVRLRRRRPGCGASLIFPSSTTYGGLDLPAVVRSLTDGNALGYRPHPGATPRRTWIGWQTRQFMSTLMLVRRAGRACF